MKIKTYGINGLLEWHGTLHTGNTRMNVSFRGGTVTGYGVAPAMFTTKDEFTQYVIENSEQYKKKRIFLVRERVVPGTENTENTQAPKPKKEPAETPTTFDAPLPTETETEKKTVEVTDWDDAREYLANNCGVARRYMRSHAAVLQYASENNVNFVGLGDEGE